VHAPDRFTGTHIVSTREAIDAAVWPDGALVLRLAPDEVLASTVVNSTAVDDPHAIVELETGFFSVWLDHAAAIDVLERECDWELPQERPAFAQGIVAGLPMKLWFERDRVLFIVPSPFAADLMERLR
jgi:hypothetical protein